MKLDSKSSFKILVRNLGNCEIIINMAAHMLESYDTAFLGIFQHEGNITNFLDVVYGFLYRR